MNYELGVMSEERFRLEPDNIGLMYKCATPMKLIKGKMPGTKK